MRFFYQVLKPATRKKLRIEGELCPKMLAELFQSVPSFLGGSCDCGRCCVLPQAGKTQRLPLLEGMAVTQQKLPQSQEDPDVGRYGALKRFLFDGESSKMKTIIGITLLFLFFIVYFRFFT